jgi:lipoyl(octanoyl) transferase
MKFVDWGLIDYQEAWDRQKAIAAQILAQKAGTLPHTPAGEHDYQQIVFCEHPHVYTLGRHGKANNLLVNQTFLRSIKAAYYHINRGGDITYHGPGQIVGYPILDLERLKISLKDYIFLLEAVIIKTLQHHHLKAERLAGATGVWIDAHQPGARKICAIGVHASRYVTTHGFALNVNTDLSYYRHINPCGFVDKGVTSIRQECHSPIDITAVKQQLQQCFLETGVFL